LKLVEIDQIPLVPVMIFRGIDAAASLKLSSAPAQER